MSTTESSVHPTLEALGEHLKGLATVKLEQTKARLASDAEQAEANRIAEARRLEIESDERIRLVAMANDLKHEEAVRVAQQQKEPLREMRRKYSALYQACPLIAQELEEFLQSPDLSRDWPQVVRNTVTQLEKLASGFSYSAGWLMSGSACAHFARERWAKFLSELHLSDFDKASAEFSMLRSEAERLELASNAAAVLEAAAAKKALDEELEKAKRQAEMSQRRVARILEYKEKRAPLEKLGLINEIWFAAYALCMPLILVGFTVVVIWPDSVAGTATLVYAFGMALLVLLLYIPLSPDRDMAVAVWFPAASGNTV